MPLSSEANKLQMVIMDLLEILKHPQPASPFLIPDTKLNKPIRLFEQLLHNNTKSKNETRFWTKPGTKFYIHSTQKAKFKTKLTT